MIPHPVADFNKWRTKRALPVAAYGLAHGAPEPEIVARLFKLYADKVKVLDNPA